MVCRVEKFCSIDDWAGADDRPVGNTAVETGGFISTGSLGLDLATGGGYPRGAVSEVFGPEASGKSALALLAAAEVQQAGGVAAYIDAEQTVDAGFAQLLGVDCGKLLFSQPTCGEEALEICHLLCGSCGVDLVIVDSVAALSPKKEIIGRAERGGVDTQSGMLALWLRRFSTVLRKSNAALLFINQARVDLRNPGNSGVSAGGRALRLQAALRVQLAASRYRSASGGTNNTLKVRSRIIRNRQAQPYRRADFDLHLPGGVWLAAECFDLGLLGNLIRHDGENFYLGRTCLGGSREDAAKVIGEHPQAFAWLQQRLRGIDSGV